MWDDLVETKKTQSTANDLAKFEYHIRQIWRDGANKSGTALLQSAGNAIWAHHLRKFAEEKVNETGITKSLVPFMSGTHEDSMKKRHDVIVPLITARFSEYYEELKQKS